MTGIVVVVGDSLVGRWMKGFIIIVLHTGRRGDRIWRWWWRSHIVMKNVIVLTLTLSGISSIGDDGDDVMMSVRRTRSRRRR